MSVCVCVCVCHVNIDIYSIYIIYDIFKYYVCIYVMYMCIYVNGFAKVFRRTGSIDTEVGGRRRGGRKVSTALYS